jgi:NAD(P)-dependent dehydrogenase (short-subunit alcohol dehydrogenase family)
VADQRVAVITGASSGIGEATARLLAKDGWRCVLLARREDRLRPLAEELGGEFELLDVADRAAVDRVAAAILERHPRIGLLMNNAGIGARAGFFDCPPERIDEVTAVNYLGSVWCLRAFLPGLEAAAPSDVVNVVSVAGTVAFPPSGPYTASKHAQLALSRAASAELRGRGIRVHTVNPGFVETEGFPQATTLSSSIFRRVVIGPEKVARHIHGLVGRGPSETFIPGFYRPLAILQALLPGTVGRFAARSGYRPPAP